MPILKTATFSFICSHCGATAEDHVDVEYDERAHSGDVFPIGWVATSGFLRIRKVLDRKQEDGSTNERNVNSCDKDGNPDIFCSLRCSAEYYIKKLEEIKECD